MVVPLFLKRTVRTIKKIFNTTVSVKEGASRSVLRGIIQYDTLNEVNIRLSDGSKAFDYTGYTNIIFKVLKADGTTYIDSEGARVIATSPADGVVTVILSGQATTAAGLCQSVIEVYAGGEKMTTARFNYEVFGALEVDEDAVASEPEYSVLQNLVSDVSELEALIEAAEAARVTAEEERVAAETARKEAEIKREDKETGYVSQAAAYANDAMNAERRANNYAQETSVDRAIVDQMRVETRGYSAEAEESARQAAASAEAAKVNETLVLDVKASAEQSAAAAAASASEATTAAAQIADDATFIKDNIASAVESAEDAEYAEMLAERWASTAKGWAEGGEVVTNVRIDDEGRTVFTIADAHGAKQYAADAAASVEAIAQYETDLGAAVQSAQSSATKAKTSEDAAVAAQAAAEKARDEAQSIAGGDFANNAYVDSKMEEAVSTASQYTDSEIWDHNYSTSAHGDIRGRIYNVEQQKPLIVTVAKNDSGVYQADQYMEDIARAGNNGRVVIAVVATYGVDGDDGKPIDYDLYYMTDCHIVNRGVAAFTVNEIRFRNANGGEIVITSDEMVEVIETTAESDVFIATYGETTLQEVDAAYKANKAVFCYLEGLGISPMVAYDHDTAIFMFVSTDTKRIVCTKLDDEWSADLLSATPTLHAETHAIGGYDPITPEMIGAVSSAELEGGLEEVGGQISIHTANKSNPHGVTAAQVGAPTVAEMNAAIAAVPTPDVSGQINTHNSSSTAHADIRELIANKKGAQVYTATIGTSWTENADTGVKSQTVSISGVTASHTAKVDHSSASIDGTSDGYATFVEEENQYLTCITNGYAETVSGGITFYVFGEVPTVAIPIVVEVV